MAKVESGKIDNDVLDLLQKEQIDLGLSCEYQFRRTELNFYLELYGVIKRLNEALDKLNHTINICGEDKIMEYFKVANENFKKEEIRAKNQAKIHKEHKKKGE